MPPMQKAASYRPAAILVPLLRVQSDWHILLTKRAAHLAHHAGQISFPGGKVEPCDASPVEAALREAFEEIQLTPGSEVKFKEIDLSSAETLFKLYELETQNLLPQIK